MSSGFIELYGIWFPTAVCPVDISAGPPVREVVGTWMVDDRGNVHTYASRTQAAAQLVTGGFCLFPPPDDAEVRRIGNDGRPMEEAPAS